MMYTKSCKTLHRYLNDDKFDVKLLEEMLNEAFGSSINNTKNCMETYFYQDIQTLR